MLCALDLDLDKAGKSMLAKMAMIAMTTSSSINVNAARFSRSSSSGEPRIECGFEAAIRLRADELSKVGTPGLLLGFMILYLPKKSA